MRTTLLCLMLVSAYAFAESPGSGGQKKDGEPAASPRQATKSGAQRAKENDKGKNGGQTTSQKVKKRLSDASRGL